MNHQILEILKRETIEDTLLSYQFLLEQETFNSKELTETKNKLIRNEINYQLKTKGIWKVNCPFTNTCHACNGLGQKVRIKEPIINDCKKCHGTGSIDNKPCKKCFGSGDIKKFVWLKINKHTDCKQCNGTGIFKKNFKKNFNPVFSPAMGDKLKHLINKHFFTN